MLPVPSIADLAGFTGREVDTFSSFADSVLQHATLLFELVTRLEAMPEDPAQAALATNAILEMAGKLYSEAVYAEYVNNPFQSETIGSYSYSMKSPTALRAQSGGDTGLLWWDLAIDRLSVGGTVVTDSGSLGGGFEDSELGVDFNGRRGIHMPGNDSEWPPYIRIS